MFLARDTMAFTVLQAEGSSCINEELRPEVGDALLKEAQRQDPFLVGLQYSTRSECKYGMNIYLI